MTLDKLSSCYTYRASSVAHSYVTFNIQCWRTGEPERFHIGEYLSFEKAALGPGSTESADQFIVDRTSVLIDQLDPFISAVVSVAIVYDNVETICEHRGRNCIAEARLSQVHSVEENFI